MSFLDMPASQTPQRNSPEGAAGQWRAQYRSRFPWKEAVERDACLDDGSDARLYRKGPGKEAKLCFIGHGLMENRHGLLVDACLTPADGHAERVAALATIEPRADRPRANTLGADEAYDAEDFVNELRSMTVTPHVAQNTSGRSSAIDARTTRHGGDAAIAREMVVGPVLEYANLSYLSTAAALGNRHANRRLCTSNPMYVISFIRPALHA
jgi:hypothetical protein